MVAVTGTFDDIEVYPDVDLTCSICGAVGEPEWMDWSINRQVRRLSLQRIHCPNGPHKLTKAQWEEMKPSEPVWTAPDDLAPPSMFYEQPKRRWWWSR